MSSTPNPAGSEVGALLDQLAAAPDVQSNCMFQLALMLARVAMEPCPDAYKEETGQALLALIRAKPKSNVVRLFGAVTPMSDAHGDRARKPRMPLEAQSPGLSVVVPSGAMPKRS